MSTVSELIPSFQRILSNYKFPNTNRVDEQFAITRFLKKFEVPDDSATSSLRSECWDNYITFDNNLILDYPLPGIWYKVREFLHRELVPTTSNSVRLPKGSEFRPTRGFNSLQARLETSRWTVTEEAFPRFCTLCYRHKGLKRAVGRRYKQWYTSRKFSESLRESNKIIYESFKDRDNFGFLIFQWKLRQIVEFTKGSRFSTVPKNNLTRRPINIEPFGNIICQAEIGDSIRNTWLPKLHGVDLNNLQIEHRRRISDVESIATIDLKNASDSISLSLVEFLFPKWFVSRIKSARSEFVYGPDGNYYLLNKVSSMGNGFTFELMTLILTTLCRLLDPSSSVFGDDIIIDRTQAGALISALVAAGFVVNEDKSFIDGPFRESCGANYHKSCGYVESYDFMYPETIGDCVVIFNKLVRLQKKYPAFHGLWASLVRVIPKPLQGGRSLLFETIDYLELVGRSPTDDFTDLTDIDSITFPPFFVTKKGHRKVCDISDSKSVEAYLSSIQEESRNFTVATAFKFVSDERTPCRKHLKPADWAKYEMYLDSGRKARDVITGRGKWVSFQVLNNGWNYFQLSKCKLT